MPVTPHKARQPIAPVLAFVRKDATVQPRTLAEKVAALEALCPIRAGVVERVVDKFLEGDDA